MNNIFKKYNHQIRNLIPLTKREINSLKENITHEELFILIQSYNDSLIMCNDVINNNYKDIIKK
jgi:hypothetical protein